MWCVPVIDAEFIDRMEDVLEVYARPLDAREPVVCIDERPVVLHDSARPSIPLSHGKVARTDYEYVRRGTANIFCIVEPLTGRRLTHATANRTGRAFAQAVRKIARRYSRARRIHLVLDNLLRPPVSSPAMTVEEFVERWKDSQAAEKSNAQSFLNDLCAALGVDAPQPARSEGKDEYVFERRVSLPHEEKATVGFIDLYKRGAFVLEAKQGSTTSARLGTAKRDTPQWTQAMQDARGQALGYARVLDEPVPFIVVTDVGHCFDLYSCFDGSNSFRPFPTPLEFAHLPA